MQNTEASVTFAGVPRVIGPAVEPFSVIVRHCPFRGPEVPKHPAVPVWPLPWPGQKCPADRSWCWCPC